MKKIFDYINFIQYKKNKKKIELIIINLYYIIL